jgi:hypothetical protein
MDNSLGEDGSCVAFRSFATNLLAPGVDTNGDAEDAFVRCGPFLGPGSEPVGPGGAGDDNPVTFSVNGPVDPGTEGLRDARGVPPTPPLGPQPGNMLAYCTRVPPVTQAAGLPSFRPGDVNDHVPAGVPSEAQMFQSAPPPPPPGGAPDGTNNQILTPLAMGQVAGLGVLPPFWVALPPMAMPRDNIDAFSFGEDYFPDMIMTGYATPPPFLPPPPVGVDGEIAPTMLPWAARVSVYAEPVVIATSAPGMSLRFSVDPWAMGLPATAVFVESGGGADVGAFCGPWVSLGAAAGDVFGTGLLMRVAGATVGGGGNVLVHDNPTLALAAALPDTSEDDIDALECVGDNNVPWFMMAPAMPGNLHDRVMDVGPDLPAPGMSSHDVVNTAPLFFSVTRSSPGAPFSAVRSQFVMDGGASSDIFVTAKGATPPGVGTNLVFIDESEIGLYAAGAPPVMGTSPVDQTDDLDGLILWVSPALRMLISATIDSLMATTPWMPDPATGANVGPGMTMSIVSMLADEIMPGDIRVAFSVTTDAIGLEYTAVDYEAGPVFPPGGPVSAAGDVFYAEPDGEIVNPNYLLFEEVDLGVAAGPWMNGFSMDLAELADNVDALDSTDEPLSDPGEYVPPTDTREGRAPRLLELEPPRPNPFNPTTTLSYSLPARGPVRLTILDVRGRAVAMLIDEVQDAGRHVVTWAGRDARGQAMSSGIYLAQLDAAGEQRMRKLVLLK